MLLCSIHNNENYGSDAEGLPDFEELLESSFNPDISENEEEVEENDYDDSLGLELTALSL